MGLDPDRKTTEDFALFCPEMQPAELAASMGNSEYFL